MPLLNNSDFDSLFLQGLFNSNPVSITDTVPVAAPAKKNVKFYVIAPSYIIPVYLQIQTTLTGTISINGNQFIIFNLLKGDSIVSFEFFDNTPLQVKAFGFFDITAF
jgi:hypothetical protein